MAAQEIQQLPVLPARPADSHKGDCGKILVVAGCRGMSGAAVLCGSAALRAGAGLVRVAVPEEIQPTVAAGNPCYTTVGLPPGDQGRLLDLANDNDVAAVGPGLGRGEDIAMRVQEFIARTSIPIVLDADGLHAMVGRVDALGARKAPLLLTPHPGEFARLLGLTTADVQGRRRDLSIQFAAEHRLIVVLKGHGTIVTDGGRFYQNATGNPGMATGGTGDVLTGIIAALIGQGLSAFDAAVLGVHVHGLAGDLARDQLGEISLTALDLLDYLPAAFRSVLR